MESQSLLHSTFTLERRYPQSPDRVFAAFAQPARKRRWYAEGDHEIQEFEMEFQVGGVERFRYRFKEGHPIAGSEIANESIYHEITPESRIVWTSKMSLNGKAIMVMVATLEFTPAEAGTEMVLTHQAAYIDWPHGAQMLEAGWRALFDRLETYLAD